jgi:hypothetical protein
MSAVLANYILSSAVAAAWLPVMWKFYRDYMARPEEERHPASLAIISALAVLVFHALAPLMLPGWAGTRFVILGAELYAVVQFAWAFKRGQKKPLVRRITPVRGTPAVPDGGQHGPRQ